MIATEQSAVQLKSIQPTKWGWITLSSFPVDALLWADSNLHRLPSKGDRFKQFTSLCVDWCTQSGVRPNWRQMYEQRKLQGMPPQAPMLEGIPKKGVEWDGSRTRKSSSSSGGTPLPPLAPDEVFRYSKRYRVLSVVETQIKQAAFIVDPNTVASVDILTKLIGPTITTALVEHVFNNLKYEEVKQTPQDKQI